MQVTAKKGRGTKMHISADEQYVLTVTADFWYAQGIAQGAELDDAQWADFCERAQNAKALEKALNLLTFRDHSQKELERKLARVTDKDAAQYAAQRVAKMGFVDDARYAQRLAEELVRRKGMAPRRIKQELLSRGVAKDDIDAALEALPFDAAERIAHLLETKFKKIPETPKEQKRMFDTLVRLGYDYSDIRSALREYAADDDYDD